MAGESGLLWSIKHATSSYFIFIIQKGQAPCRHFEGHCLLTNTAGEITIQIIIHYYVCTYYVPYQLVYNPSLRSKLGRRMACSIFGNSGNKALLVTCDLLGLTSIIWFGNLYFIVQVPMGYNPTGVLNKDGDHHGIIDQLIR